MWYYYYYFYYGNISSTTTNMAYSQHYLVMYQAHTTTAKSLHLILVLIRAHRDCCFGKQGFDEKPVERWDLVCRRLEEE